MNVDLLIRAAALVTVLGTGVVYGTDVFCAMVLRPALARVDDGALVAVMGMCTTTGTGGCRCPACSASLPLQSARSLRRRAAHWVQAAAAGTAVAALLMWLLLYTRLSAPINRQLTAAAETGQMLPNGRALQAKWDSIINARAALQSLAVAASCVVLLA